MTTMMSMNDALKHVGIKVSVPCVPSYFNWCEWPCLSFTCIYGFLSLALHGVYFNSSRLDKKFRSAVLH
jgi:hypothetical protein